MITTKMNIVTVPKSFVCPLSLAVEQYKLPEEDSQRFDFFVRDIDFLNKSSYGLGLMQTMIEFTDAFSKYMIK